MGIAMGCVGMSLRDFDLCSPLEFEEIVEQWKRGQDAHMQASWEQARFVAMASLQPFCKKSLKPSDITVFPWERKSSGDGAGMPDAPKSTKERMLEMERRLNGNG